MQQNIDIIMPKNFIKESEERDYLERFIEYLKTQKEDVTILEFPVLLNLAQGENVADAIIKRNGKLCFSEVVTMSRFQEERKAISLERNKKVLPNNKIYTINLSWALEEARAFLREVIIEKCAKDYSKFMQIKNVLSGVLLIGFVYEGPFFNVDDLYDLLKMFDEDELYLLGCGNSNFDEIYFCTHVQEKQWGLAI